MGTGGPVRDPYHIPYCNPFISFIRASPIPTLPLGACQIYKTDFAGPEDLSQALPKQTCRPHEPCHVWGRSCLKVQGSDSQTITLLKTKLQSGQLHLRGLQGVYIFWPFYICIYLRLRPGYNYPGPPSRECRPLLANGMLDACLRLGLFVDRTAGLRAFVTARASIRARKCPGPVLGYSIRYPNNSLKL